MSYSQDLTSRVASIVLAGGQGTRLFPLTELRCKPAVSFGGRYRLIDIPISNSLNSGIKQIFVISQFFASELQQHIMNTFHLDLFGSGKIEMLCPEENMEGKRWFKGTADAVRQNLHYLLKAPVDYFLILSGDQLYNINFLHMLQYFIEKDADFLVAALPVSAKEAKRMGLLKIDETSHILDFCEKPQDPAILSEFALPDKRYLGSMGIYIFKREVLRRILQEEGEDFGKHVIPAQIKKRKSIAFIYDGYWEDIGTIASYYQANLALTEENSCLNIYDENNPIYTCPHNLPSPIIKNTLICNAIISQGAIVEAKEITHSIVGIRTHIKKNTTIRDSIILGNHFYHAPLHQHPPLPLLFTIGENCVLEKVIIDEHTFLGNDVHLTNVAKLQKYDGAGIYIRDGIIIVTSGTHLADGFKL